MFKIPFEDLTPEIQEAINKLTPIDLLLAVLILGFFTIFAISFYIFICWLALKINRKIFKKFEKKNGSNITMQFLQKAVSLALIVVFVVFPLGGQKLAASLLGSTAVVAAVVGLAANDVIKDMFAGLEISIYKPFDLGSRIMLEDGRAGIVEEMNLRHVVLAMIDTTKLIVPNSKINAMILTNYSYDQRVPRSFDARFAISYKADINKAKEIIRKVICDIEFSLNQDVYNTDLPNSRSVYLLEITESALILGATIYYPHNIRTEVMRDEVNTMVFEALSKNGIEMTYDCMNIIMRNDL